MSIKIYLDGAGLADMARLAGQVDGFTTNPSLMKSAGITDYARFAREVLAIADGKPVSFEVLNEDPIHMKRQANIISSWGENVFVKVPIVTSVGSSTAGFIRRLVGEGIKVNVTAVFTNRQVSEAAKALGDAEAILSIFAGRIADTGVDPYHIFPPYMVGRPRPNYQVLWASTREVFNVAHAEAANADIITMSPALFDKMTALQDKDLEQYSIETVKQFIDDAKGFSL